LKSILNFRILFTIAASFAIANIAHANNNSTGDIYITLEDHEAAKIKAEAEARKTESEAEMNERKYWQDFQEKRLAFDDKVFADMLKACEAQNKRKGPVGSFNEPLAGAN
jgi:hypothetical protein